MGESKIIIKRKSSIIGCAGNYTVEVDGNVVGKLANGKTIDMMVSAGEHILKFSFWKNETVININTDGENDLYFSAKIDNSTGKLNIYSQDNQLLNEKSKDNVRVQTVVVNNTTYCTNKKTNTCKTYKSEFLLLGFRSNKVWKKIFSTAYLVVLGMFFIAVMFEGRYENITIKDFVISKICNGIIFMFFFSPYIFLSQTKFRDKIPLFKKHKVWANIIGFLIFFILTICLNDAINEMHTNEYIADMQNHAYKEITIDATCDKDGKIEKLCEYCGSNETSQIIAALGHTMKVVSDDEVQLVKECELCGKQEITEKTTQANNGENTEKNKEINTKTSDKIIKLLMDKCNISETEAEQVKKDFESVGINDLTGFTQFEGAGVEGMKSFEYTSATVSGTLILTNNGTNYTTNYISTGDITLFDSFKGGVIDHISHYYLSKDEKSLYLYQTEEYIKQCLRSPATADFPNWYTGLWQIGRKDDVITVVSYVDAQNAFGAIVRSKFIVQFSYTTQLCTYCQLDGEVIFGTFQEV